MMWHVWLLLAAAVAGRSRSDPELLRDLSSLKTSLTNIESRLDQFQAMFLLNLDKKITDQEGKLESISNKLDELSSQKGPVEKLRQEITMRNGQLQRLSRNFDSAIRKQNQALDRKQKDEATKLEKIGDNLQNISKTFNTLCRKIDTLQKELEKERGPHFHGSADSEDFRTFLGLRLANLEMAASKMTKCIECNHPDVPMKEELSGMLDNVVHRLQSSRPCSELEIAVARIVENQIREVVKEFKIDLLRRFEKVNLLMDDLKAICEERPSESISPPIELRRLEEAAQRISSDDSNKEVIHPGRMFRKLWRRLTEPIQKIEAKIDSLKASYEYSAHRFCNESTGRAIAPTDKQEMYLETCMQNQNTLREANARLERMEANLGGLCSVRSGVKAPMELEIFPTSTAIPQAQDGGYESGNFHPLSCADIQMQGISENGVYTIRPKKSPTEFLAYCDFKTDGGGYTVVQRRGDFGEPHANFTQDWAAYRDGFGDLLLEFWLGNEKLHLLTTQEPVRLRVELEDFEGNRSYAEYSRFLVASEENQYRLSVSGYSGNSTDSFSLHDAKMFSTFDRDNDEVNACCNCATTFKGGWWYYKCFEANLNGPYHTNPTDNGYFQGIIWERWMGDYSLRASEMKIRPLQFDRRDSP